MRASRAENSPGAQAIRQGSEFHVSSQSRWGDTRWFLDFSVPGTNRCGTVIYWDFKLPDGSCFSEPVYDSLRETAKRLIWSLHTDPPPDHRALRLHTLVHRALSLRLLLCWMRSAEIRHFCELDAAAVDQYCTYLRQRRGASRARPVSAATIASHLTILRDFYLQRSKLPDALEHDPLQERSIRHIAGYRECDRGILPFTPEAVAVPLISGAIRLLRQPAEDLIALRDDCVETYQETLARGVSENFARACVRNQIQAFRFSRIEDDASPWQAPLIGVEQLKGLIDHLYTACFLVISYLVGPRISEILSLRAGCLVQRFSPHGGDPFSMIEGRIYKTDCSGLGQPHQWVAPEPACRAIDVLEQLSRPPRHATGRDELWLTFLGGNHGMSTLFASDSTRWGIPSKSAINERLNRFAVWLTVPDYQGQRWHLSSHQGRKTFARFVALRDRSGLFALAQHFGHADRAMTDFGYACYDADLLKEVDAQIIEQSIGAWEHLLAAEQVAGKAGEEILERRPKFKGETAKDDRLGYARLMVDAGLTLAVCGWGYCVYRQDYSACHGSGGGPNPVYREPSTCARCANFAVTEKHAPYWQEQLRRNTELLHHEDLPAQTRFIAEHRVGEARRLLDQLAGTGSAGGSASDA